MRKESLFAYILRLTATLLVITALVALALAGVNAITAPVIAELKAQKTQAAVEAVLPGGGAEVDFTDDSGMVKTVYASEAGYAVLVETNGFGGKISMMVGVDKAGKVLGVSIISHAETPSLGAVAADKTSNGQAFRDQFVGQTGTLTVGDSVEAISGATITSQAVTDGVNAAQACVAVLEQGGAA